MGSSMGSFSIAVSGLRAAQLGLSTTGHNVTNAEVTGYTRQQTIQGFSTNLTIGICASGSGKLQVGLGTDVSVIRQIRSKFLDIRYRNANAIQGYYSPKYATGNEVENIIGELESDYKAQDVLRDIWDAINELSIYPDGIETRTSFIETCVTFMDKMKNIGDNLFNYQINLNEQVKDCVNQINSNVARIKELNLAIVIAEKTGAKANDLRDERNNLLDDLSGLCDIQIKYADDGRIDILTLSGDELLVNNWQSTIGLRYCNGDYPFVEPVFTTETKILSAADTNAKALYPRLDTEVLTGESEKARGTLKGLLVSRGEVVANYTTDSLKTNNYVIPRIQKQIDTIFHAVVTMLNDAVTSTAADPRYDLNGNESTTEIFSRITGYKDDPYIKRDEPEDPNNTATLYSMYNTVINSKILQTDGYNYLAFSRDRDDLGDPGVLNELSEKWKTESKDMNGNILLNGHSIDSYYRSVISDFSILVEEALGYSEASETMLDVLQNDRYSLSGVSLDEELSNMLKYQHAYNAASRMVTVIDQLLDRVVNGTGRVGL